MNLDDLQKLCDAATPGPWKRAVACHPGDPGYYPDSYSGAGPLHAPTGKPRIDFGDAEQEQAGRDADLIAAARTYLPRLIAVARAGKTLHEAPYVSIDGSEASDAYDALGAALADLEAP